MTEETTEAPVESETEVVELPVPTLDVEIADLPKKRQKGEFPPLILAGYWVRLGDSEEVPSEFVGHIAAVLDSPFTSVPFAGDSDETIHGYRYNKGKLFTVQTRDTANAILSVSQDAFAEVADSRASLLNHA